MGEANLPDLIKNRPVPERQDLADGTSVMNWGLEMSLPISVADLERVTARLTNQTFVVQPERVGPSQLLISIRCELGVSYTELWDFSSRSLLTVEKLLGAIVSIEGTPRDDWKLQFVVAEHVEAFAADKTAPMVAAESGDITQLTAILASYPDIDLNETTPFGLSALGYAAEKGHTEIVTLLLKSGAKSTSGGEITTLQAAVLGGVEVIRLLLGSGADVNGTNRYGETALMTAAALGKVVVARELLKHDGDPNVEDNRGTTALERAQLNQRADIVRLLQ